MGSSSMFSLERWDLAPGEAISQSPPNGALPGARTLLCPPPTLDTDEYIAQNAFSEDCSSVDSLAEFGLAPGETTSQTPPLRALQGGPTLLCPPPTLDTDDFLAHNAISEDCSSLDSMADFGLAPGEARSESPLCAFLGSQAFQCPPPSLDTHEFEKDLDFADPWIVEDSQAKSECRSLGSLDPLKAPNQFCSPSLENQKFEDNRSLWGDVVEDSLPPWDYAVNQATLQRQVDQSKDFNREGLPLSVDVPANKRSLCPTSTQGDSGNSNMQAELASGAKFSGEVNGPFPIPSTGRAICGEGYAKVQRLSTSGSLREQEAVAKRKNFAKIFLSPPDQVLPTIVSPTISDTKLGANNVEKDIYHTFLVKEFTSTNITTATISEVKKSNHKGKGRGSPINDLTEYGRGLASEEATVNSEVVLPLANEGASTSSVRHSFQIYVRSNRNEGPSMKVTDVNADGIGEPIRCGPRAKDKVQTCLAFQRVTSQKSERQGDDGRFTDGWVCPRNGKKFKPRSRQICLDRWMP